MINTLRPLFHFTKVLARPIADVLTKLIPWSYGYAIAEAFGVTPTDADVVKHIDEFPQDDGVKAQASWLISMLLKATILVSVLVYLIGKIKKLLK